MYPTLSKHFNFFPTYTTEKKPTEKMDLRRKNMKITSEMELDFGWKTSCRKSRLSFHYFWSSSGSELKYGLQLENGKV